MKALVKKSPEKGIWLEDVPVPPCSTNDVKIKITHTAICGTDLHIYKWDEWAQRTLELPLVTGHEFCGIVEEIGPGVTHLIREIVCREKAILPAVIVETAGQENVIYVIKLWASAFIGMGRLLNIW